MQEVKMAKPGKKPPKDAARKPAAPPRRKAGAGETEAKLDEARRRADAADAGDVDEQRGAVEGQPGQRAGEQMEPGSGYGELRGEGDWGWGGQAEHRYGEYPAANADDENEGEGEMREMRERRDEE
jgi:hypothetical protein